MAPKKSAARPGKKKARKDPDQQLKDLHKWMTSRSDGKTTLYKWIQAVHRHLGWPEGIEPIKPPPPPPDYP